MQSRGRGHRAHLIALVAAAALAAGAAVPAAGEDTFNPLGDGAGFNNADLLRDPTTGCTNCAPNPPHEWDEPWFDVDWSLGLRGSYVQTTTSQYFEAALVPQVTLQHNMLRGGYSFSASAQIDRSTLEDLRLSAVNAGLAGSYRLDNDIALAGKLDLSISQGSAKAPGVDPNIVMQPLVLKGDGELSAARELGPLIFTGRLNGSRSVYGPTTMIGPVETDNTHQSNWVGGVGLRVGYRVTPLLTAFVDGSVGHQWYDAVSPTYLVRLDATDYQARTGLSVAINEVLEAEASIGYGLRRFDEAALGEASSLLYDGSVIFRPDETLELKGTFSTTFGAPGADSGGTARLEYAAVGDVAYTVNPWLKLRASAGWRHAELIGTADTETAWNAGVGADYVLNEVTTVNADYVFTRSQSTPDPAEDAHRVTLGLTFHR